MCCGIFLCLSGDAFIEYKQERDEESKWFRKKLLKITAGGLIVIVILTIVQSLILYKKFAS